MAYEKVQDLSTDVVLKIGGFNDKTNKANPTTFEGFYLGKREVQTQNGPAIIHTFNTPKGNVGVWGSKELNDKLSQVSAGTMTLIEYGGKKKLAGGKSLHTYTVSQDKTNRLEVDTLEAGNVTAGDEYTDGDGGYDDGEAEAELLASQKVKQAKVQEILNRGKNKGN